VRIRDVLAIDLAVFMRERRRDRQAQGKKFPARYMDQTWILNESTSESALHPERQCQGIRVRAGHAGQGSSRASRARPNDHQAQRGGKGGSARPSSAVARHLRHTESLRIPDAHDRTLATLQGRALRTGLVHGLGGFQRAGQIVAYTLVTTHIVDGSTASSKRHHSPLNDDGISVFDVA